MPEQICPLCGAEAGFEGIDFGRKKKYACENCKLFVVSSSIEKIISALTEDQKKKFIEASQKCGEEEILLIFHDEKSGEISSRCELEQKWS